PTLGSGIAPQLPGDSDRQDFQEMIASHQFSSKNDPVPPSATTVSLRSHAYSSSSTNGLGAATPFAYPCRIGVQMPISNRRLEKSAPAAHLSPVAPSRAHRAFPAASSKSFTPHTRRPSSSRQVPKFSRWMSPTARTDGDVARSGQTSRIVSAQRQ